MRRVVGTVLLQRTQATKKDIYDVGWNLLNGITKLEAYLFQKNEDVMKWREINNKWEVEHKAYMNQWLEERKKQNSRACAYPGKKIYNDFAENERR